MTMATTSAVKASSPARTAKPKPLGEDDRSGTMRGFAAASPSTTRAVPSVEPSSTTTIS
jgi:hypothetical protein